MCMCTHTHMWLPFLNKSRESHWGPCFLRLWGNASKDTKETSTKWISSAHDDTVDPFPLVCRVDLRTFQIELGCLYLLNMTRIFCFLQPNVTQWRREVWVLCNGLDSPNLLFCQRCSRSEARELTFSYILLSQKMMPTYFLQIEEDLYEVEELHSEKSWYKKCLTIVTVIYPKEATTQRQCAWWMRMYLKKVKLHLPD